LSAAKTDEEVFESHMKKIQQSLHEPVIEMLEDDEEDDDDAEILAEFNKGSRLNFLNPIGGIRSVAQEVEESNNVRPAPAYNEAEEIDIFGLEVGEVRRSLLEYFLKPVFEHRARENSKVAMPSTSASAQNNEDPTLGYPCSHCEKAFKTPSALKRHKFVFPFHPKHMILLTQVLA